jgi:hypothetical protein
MSNNSKALATIVDPVAIEEILTTSNVIAIQRLPAVQQAIVLASGLAQLREIITVDVTKRLFLPLCGTRLGFVTDLDRKEKAYPIEVIRDCVIDAMLHGLRPVGNEFNIISGNMYPAQAGLGRLVREYQGLTNLELIPGIPNVKEGRAAVPYLATWLLNGTRMTLECRYDEATKLDTRILVTVNNGMGPDAILGKAERKIYARILKRISGMWVTDGDDADVINTTAEPSPVVAPEHDGKRMGLDDLPRERQMGED